MEIFLDFIREQLGSPGLAILLSNPNFAFIQLLNSISMGMNYFIIAAGLSLIFGVLKVINFAHGAFYMFGAYIAYSVTELLGLGFFWAVIGAALGLVVIAFVIERCLFRFIYDKEHLMQLLLTFALVLILGDLAKVIWGTDQYSVAYPTGLSGATDLGITFYPTYRLMLCVLGPAIFIGLWLCIERTRWGRITKAATQDRDMLSALGINVSVIYTVIFLLLRLYNKKRGEIVVALDRYTYGASSDSLHGLVLCLWELSFQLFQLHVHACNTTLTTHYT